MTEQMEVMQKSAEVRDAVHPKMHSSFGSHSFEAWLCFLFCSCLDDILQYTLKKCSLFE